EQGQPITKIFPHLPHYREMSFCSAQEATAMPVDLVFLCLPAGHSAKWAKPFLEKSVKIIDLGADFRYDSAASYEHWCAEPHPDPALLKNFTYGLPEWNREQIKIAPIVSNPGCYPTTVLLPVIPLLKTDTLAPGPIIVDSKSGISGAGASPSKATHYGAIHENFSAYKPGRVHRHVGEMEQELSKAAGRPIQVVFTPHLAPMFRGLFSTIYVRLKSNLKPADLIKLLAEAYVNEPFVKVLTNDLPSAKMANHSNFCFLSATTVANSEFAILFSAIDNLGKGASWQAVQNMNLMLGFPETMGLL
ncbi:MAG: N-acetyl-gamma-glutamyl-phosphate reductase, partial [candidate division KSB1 bacterium]|nr:N-acetyl-gamma-glutamyl-phosphate reductase [candidate division KSB1 bacterium]